MSSVNRRQFWRRSIANGYSWASDATDHLGRVLIILGLFGFPVAAIVLTRLPVWLVLPVIGLVVLIALGEGAYMTSTDLANTAQLQASLASRAPHPDHVKDLQSEARRMREVVMRPSFTAVNLSSVLASYFCSHFADLNRELVGWNQNVVKLNRSAEDLSNRVIRTDWRSKVDGVSSSLGDRANEVVRGRYALKDVVWRVFPSRISNELCMDNGLGYDEDVIGIPAGTDALAFARDVQVALEDAFEWREGVEFREALTALRESQLSLANHLEACALNHAPTGSCPGCP